MIAVADTSPLNYPVLIDHIHLLPTFFEKILVPQAVFHELHHPKTSQEVRQWVAHLPAWMEARSVASVTNPSLLHLDIGEREVIQLALDARIDTVLMDEAEGRREAKARHLGVRGTLGILERAARMGKIDFRHALNRLESTNFRVSPAVHDAFLRRNQ